MREVQQHRELRSVTRAAQHVCITVAFIFVWLHLSYVKPHVRHQDWQLYSLYFLAVAGVAARYLTGIRHGHSRWHRVLFDGLSILFIALGVNLTGGIYSDLWLVYLIFVIAETLAASARGFLITDTIAFMSYVVATWPREAPRIGEFPQAYLEILGTRIFFMVLIASIARTIAWDERLRQADVGALQEALSVSEERRRLARDLHDGIGHTLTRVILSLEVGRRQIPVAPEAAAECVAQQAQALRGAMEEMREIVATLRTDTGTFNLRGTLHSLVAQLAESESLKVDLRIPDGPLPLTPHAQYHLSRVIQEALTNCMRHADTHHAEVEVRVVESPVGRSRVNVMVSDQGRGFNLDALGSASGHGLGGMQERLAPYDGRVTVVSEPGAGTRVCVDLPGDLDTWLPLEK